MTVCHTGGWTLAEPPDTDEPVPAPGCPCGCPHAGWADGTDRDGRRRDRRQEQFDDRDRVP